MKEYLAKRIEEYLERRIEELKKEWNTIQKKYFEETDNTMSNYYYSKMCEINACIWELRAALMMI